MNKRTELDLETLSTTLVFRSRPEVIAGDLRPLWRIGIVLLILRLASRGGKSSLSKLHVLNWAIRTDENRTMLRRVIHGDVFPDTVVVRIEPSLNRALDFARGEGLVKYVAGNRVQLTPQGTDAADRLVQREGLFVKERQFLEELGKNGLTEKLVSDLFAEG